MALDGSTRARLETLAAAGPPGDTAAVAAALARLDTLEAFAAARELDAAVTYLRQVAATDGGRLGAALGVVLVEYDRRGVLNPTFVPPAGPRGGQA